MGFAHADASTLPTVGVEGEVTITLPYPDLKPAPATTLAPLLLQVHEVVEAPDTGKWLYTLRYIGFRPGAHDLSAHLRHADGSIPDDLLPLCVNVEGLLPKDHDGSLLGPDGKGPGLPGDYWFWMKALILLWALALIPLWRYGMPRRQREVIQPEAPPPTTADLLRPLVGRAASGTLDTQGKHEMELLLIRHWREALNLQAADMSASLQALRQHHESRPLLVALERWLHRPKAEAPDNIDALLTPYTEAAAPAPAREGRDA